MLPSTVSSTDLCSGFAQTRDGLSWVPKLHHGNRAPLPHGALVGSLLRVQSDPTFTRLPAIYSSRPADVKKDRGSLSRKQQPQGLPPRRPPPLGREPQPPAESLSLSPSAASRRLLHGPTAQVGFCNRPSVVLPALNATREQARNTAKDLVETQRSTFNQTGMRKSFRATFEETEFHDNLRAIKSSISDIQSSLDGFHGRSCMQQGAGTRTSLDNNLGESVATNGATRAGIQVVAEAEAEVDEHEAQRIRLMQYRYVRKIETPPEPLQVESPLTSDAGKLCLSDDDESPQHRPGSAIVRYRSPGYLKRFTPQGRKMAQAEKVDARNRNIDAARARRCKSDQLQESRALQAVALYEERMANRVRKDDQNGKKEALATVAPVKLKLQQQWQVTMAMLGFFQICAEVLFRFKILRHEYLTFLEEDFATCGSEQLLANVAGAGVQLLSRKFGEVARMKIKQEWRLPKQLKAVWCIKFENEEPIKREGDATESPLEVAAAPRSDEDGAPDAEETRPKVIVSMPYPEETSRLLRKSAYLQATLFRRIAVIRARKQASIISNALVRWRCAKPFVFMLEFGRKTRQIQKFMRWSLRRLAEVCTRVESDWIRLERDVFFAEFRHRAAAAHQAGRHRRHSDAGHSLLHRKPRRGAIALDHEVPLVQMISEERRHATVREELRNRRFKLLAKYEVWLTDMAVYKLDVQDWRRHRKACRLQNVRSDLDMPQMPPCPSHIPTDEDLVQIIQLAWDEENNIKRPAEVAPETGANAMAEALLRTATSTQMLWVKRPESNKVEFAAHDGGEDLSDDAVAEVRQLLALPVYAPIGGDASL